MNDAEIMAWLDSIDDKKVRKERVRQVGDKMLREYKALAPSKTGKFKNSIKGSAYAGGKSGPYYKIASKDNHFNIIGTMLETGTKQRQREYMVKKKNIKFKTPKSTGAVLKSPRADKLLNKYGQELYNVILSDLDKK